MDCTLNDEQKTEFVGIEIAAHNISSASKLMAAVGMLISFCFVLHSLMVWSVFGISLGAIVAGLAVAMSAGVASCGSSDDEPKPPEPMLELVDEKYRIRAMGPTGIDALRLITEFREQEERKAQRLLTLIGSAFAAASVTLIVLRFEVLPCLVPGLFAILFVAWATRVRKLKFLGFGIEVSSENDATK